jgi:hypothetical protein
MTKKLPPLSSTNHIYWLDITYYPRPLFSAKRKQRTVIISLSQTQRLDAMQPCHHSSRPLQDYQNSVVANLKRVKFSTDSFGTPAAAAAGAAPGNNNNKPKQQSQHAREVRGWVQAPVVEEQAAWDFAQSLLLTSSSTRHHAHVREKKPPPPPPPLVTTTKTAVAATALQQQQQPPLQPA